MIELTGDWLQTALGMFGAFAFAVAAAFPLLQMARRAGLVDRPGGRKRHAAPTPTVGGLTVAAGIVLGWSLFAPQMVQPGLVCAAALLLAVGVLDDLTNLNWRWRLAAQTLAATLLILIDGVRVELIGPVFGLGEGALGALSTPFTILATVGVINALNMADGVDGLAGSLAACALLMLAAAAAYAGNTDLALALAIAFAAVAGFLVFNLRRPGLSRAVMFLGNSGSEFLGLLIVWATFKLTQAPAHPVTPVLAPFLIAPVVIDCLVLLTRRLAAGRSPFVADRNHLHHLLLDRGFSPTAVVGLVCAASLSLGLTAAVALRSGVPEPVLAIAFLLLACGYALASRPAVGTPGGVGLGRRLVLARRPGLRARPASRGAGVPAGPYFSSAGPHRPMTRPSAAHFQPPVL